MIVVVSGLPGSGKSFFSEKLAHSLTADYINSDRVRKLMNATGKYSPEDKMLVYSKMLELAEKSLDKNRNVVVDATFYLEKTRNLFEELAVRKESSIYYIQITADETVIRHRLKRPRAYSEADYGVYKKIKNEFEPFKKRALQLQSTDDNIDLLLDAALQYLNHGRQ